MGRYALIIRNRQANWGQKSPQQKQEILRRYFGWIDGLVAAGALCDSQALRDGGRVLRVVDGELVDGPHTEIKEVVGGFFIVEAASWDAARQMARACPALEVGDVVELRVLSRVTETRTEGDHGLQ